MREQLVDLPTETPARRAERSALIVLCVSVFAFMGIGATWDHHWHASVGRDALISPPHVVMYLGTLLSAGAAALAAFHFLTGSSSVVNRPPLMSVGFLVRGMHAVRPGYRIVLAGAAAMVVAAIFDEVWHRTIGDRTIWSPPHVVGILGGIIVAAGTIHALFDASRDGVLPRRVGEAIRKGFPGMLLVTAYFGVLPAAVLSFAPAQAEYAFFSLTNPYIVAAIAALLLPALVTLAATQGAGGWQLTVGVGVAWWVIQEVLPLLVTPVVAAIFEYRVRPNPFPDLRFDALALAFMLIPALLTAPLIVRRPALGGAVCGLGYTMAVWIGLALANLDLRLSVGAVAGPVAIGSLSGPAGVHAGRWLHR